MGTVGISLGVSLRRAAEASIDSPANYWLVMVTDVLWAIAFLAVGCARYTGAAAVGIAAVVAGFLTWGLLE
ncbi:MAG TPA: hypothetical protein VGL62_14590, partial [Vicinamibacterales bacterium]